MTTVSTQTAVPTTRQLANRLRSALEWIDDNDTIPGGWTFHQEISTGQVELRWHSPNVGVTSVLFHEFGPPDEIHVGNTAWATWGPEGGRPGLCVFMGYSEAVALREQVTA